MSNVDRYICVFIHRLNDFAHAWEMMITTGYDEQDLKAYYVPC